MTESNELTVTIAEQLPRQTHERGCNIKFNGVDGEYGKSASLWLAEMERHREKGSSPSLYLQHIDHHLEGEAAQWMRNSPSVMALIYKGYMDIATEFDVDTFHGALCERFKLTDEEAKEVYEAAPIFRFLQLRQETSEDLANYYNRVRLHFHDFHDFHDDDRENDALTPPQQLLRSMAIYLFIRGLRSDWSFGRLLRLLQKQHISHHSVSLYQAFKIVEAQMKIVDMEKKIEQSREKEQERKRKDVNDEKAQDNAKNSKHMIMNLKLSGPTQDDEFPASSDLNEGTLVPSDNEGEYFSPIKTSSSRRNPAMPELTSNLRSQPTLTCKAVSQPPQPRERQKGESGSGNARSI